MNEPSIMVDRTDAVATVTLNLVEQRNALTLDSKEALRDAFADLANDPGVRAVVLSSAGKAFCVGQDLAEHAEILVAGAESAFATVRDHYSPIIRDLLTMPKPVIAAVAGTCVGAGLGLALACDYRVFGSGTKLATAFAGIGLTFDSGLSVTLPRAVGDARAKELILFGRTFTAEEAIAWGIAGETADLDEVLQRAVVLARELAQGPTAAYAASKRLIMNSFGSTLDDALANEAVEQTGCGAPEDHGAAVTAFLDRQAPVFTGR